MIKTEKSLSIYEFGKRLIESKDLDPIYILLWEARLDPILLKRILFSYLCYYHIGTAAWICSQKDYWEAMEKAIDKSFPRNRERRHFRGNNAVKSIAYLKSKGVSNLFSSLSLKKPQTAKELMEKVMEWVGFGPWIAFKTADMIERLGMGEVKFNLETAIYESPYKGIQDMYRLEGMPPLRDRTLTDWAITKLTNSLGHYLAPPCYEREIGLQELETVLCKFHSSLGGHYKLGEDIEGAYKSLNLFPDLDLSQRLLRVGVRGGLWK